MIYVTDVSSADVQHEQFNNSFLELLTLAHPDETIRFFGDPSHVKYISRRNRVEFRDVEFTRAGAA